MELVATPFGSIIANPLLRENLAFVLITGVCLQNTFAALGRFSCVHSRQGKLVPSFLRLLLLQMLPLPETCYVSLVFSQRLLGYKSAF